MEDRYYNDVNFEDEFYFNDGNAGGRYFNDGQGVNETPGACKTHLLTYHWRSRPNYSYARTGAKVGSNCTPKVLAKSKPEQKDSGKEPSVKEEQAKEAALRKDAIYEQKIAAWKQSN